MANNNPVVGLRPVEGQNLRARRFPLIAGESGSVAVFKNDPIKLMTSGGIQANGTTSEAFLGAVLDIYDADMVPVSYLAASTAGYATVTTNPLLRFQIRCSGTLASAAVGDTADFIATAGDTALGTSRYEISSTLKGAGNSGALRIIGLVERADNVWGATSLVEVLPELHAFVSTPKAV